LDTISEFFEKRPQYTLQHMKEFLKLKGDLVDLTIEIKGYGKIIVNTITPNFNNRKWTGKYFSITPIKLKAISDTGFNFKGWSGSVEFSEEEIEVTLFENSLIVAIFD
jgi:hypothetical protein